MGIRRKRWAEEGQGRNDDADDEDDAGDGDDDDEANDDDAPAEENRVQW